jgi:hypothetical protein
MFGTSKPWNGADGIFSIPKDDVLICREKDQFLTAGRMIKKGLHDKIRAGVLAWQRNQDFLDSGDEEAEDEELVAARVVAGGDDAASDSDQPLSKTSGVGAPRRTTAGRAQPSKDKTTVGKAQASKGKSKKSKRRKQ